MKNILLAVGLFVLWMAVLYLFWAFVAMDFNAAHWSKSSRFFLVFFSVAFGVMLTGITVENYTL